MEKDVSVSGAAEGERSSTGAAPEVKRWSANRKKEVVLRLMRGEPVDALSRELGIEIYRLEEWHQKALQGIALTSFESCFNALQCLLVPFFQAVNLDAQFAGESIQRLATHETEDNLLFAIGAPPFDFRCRSSRATLSFRGTGTDYVLFHWLSP